MAFAPWATGNTGDSRDRSPDGGDIRSAALRSVGAYTLRARSDSSPVRRRGSTASALIAGMPAAEGEGWSRGTVPDYVDLILLNDDEIASAPHALSDSRSLDSTAKYDASLPVPGAQRAPRGRGASVAKGSGVSAMPPLPDLVKGTDGKTRRRSVAGQTRGRQGGKRQQRHEPQAVTDSFVVPRAVAEQVAALRQHRWDSPSGGRPTTVGTATTTDVSYEEGIDAMTSLYTRVGPPPRVLPTVNLSPPRTARDDSPSGLSGLMTYPRGAATSRVPRRPAPPVHAAKDPTSQRAAMAWYRTEVTMLREQE